MESPGNGGIMAEEDENRPSLFLENRKKFHSHINEKIFKQIIQRNGDNSLRSGNVQHIQDMEAVIILNQQEKIHFMSLWYDLMRESSNINDGNEETAEQFLASFGVTKEKCPDEEWHQWVIALSKSAAYDRSTRRRSTSTAPAKVTISDHGTQENGEVIVPIKRESVADIRRKFNSRSKLDTTETECQKIIKRNFLPSSRMSNSTHSQDCETVQSLIAGDKIELITNWYDFLREKSEDPEFDHTESPEEFLSSFGVRRDTCNENDWHEWVIALSKSAAYDRSSKKRRNSSSKKLNPSTERPSLALDDTVGERVSDFINPVPDIPVPEDPPITQDEISSTVFVTSHDEVSSTASSSPNIHTTTPNIQSTPPRTQSITHADEFHSQVISSSHSVSEYKKALTVASVVFAQAPDEDRESMWSNVELSFSEVARTSAQSPYIKPEPAPVVSPLHSSNCQHVSIEDESQSQSPPKQSCCCLIS